MNSKIEIAKEFAKNIPKPQPKPKKQLMPTSEVQDQIEPKEELDLDELEKQHQQFLQRIN